MRPSEQELLVGNDYLSVCSTVTHCRVQAVYCMVGYTYLWAATGRHVIQQQCKQQWAEINRGKVPALYMDFGTR